MVGLIDIAPRTETVLVHGTPVPVHGISAKSLAHLLGRFPELRKLMTGQEVELEQLMAVGGNAVAPIIAAGCGFPGDQHAEDVGANLTLEAQVDLLGGRLAANIARRLRPFRRKGHSAGRPHPTGGAGGRWRRSIRYGAGFELAEAIDALIAAHYPPADVWAMTPRQIAGCLLFVQRRRRREAAEKLMFVALAARGEPRELKRQIEHPHRD